MAFLDTGKTERLCAPRRTIRLGGGAGYGPYVRGMAVKAAGQRVPQQPGQGVAAAPASASGPWRRACRSPPPTSHSPRLDLKPNRALVRTRELPIFKTHYYGGIRKYQWVVDPPFGSPRRHRPCGRDQCCRVTSAAVPATPGLVITDLLPHAGGGAGQKALAAAFPAETTELLLGRPPCGPAQEEQRAGEAGR